MLLLEPSKAEPASGPATAEDVKGGDDLPEVGDVAVRDASDEGPNTHVVAGGGEIAERGPAVEHVVPRPAELRDLPEVVHDPEVVEAGVFRSASDGHHFRA